MKILIIKRRFLKILFICIILFLCFIIFLLTTRVFDSSETISPLDLSQNEKFDFNGDGNYDSIRIINGQNKVDYAVRCKNDEYVLSDYTANKVLFNLNNHFAPSIFIHDISRDKIPELILQGCKNNKNVSYVFHFNNNNFELVNTSEKNITGILDSNNVKTPEVFCISSKEGIASLNSFMLVNNSIVDTTKSSNMVPGFDNVIKFINLTELPYVVDDIPDIFTTSINSNELSVLWNLDKDNNSYAFQNAFFYDYEWDKDGNPKSLFWRLSFEKNNLKGSGGSNEELVFKLNLKKCDSSFKISSIKIIKNS